MLTNAYRHKYSDFEWDSAALENKDLNVSVTNGFIPETVVDYVIIIIIIVIIQ